MYDSNPPIFSPKMAIYFAGARVQRSSIMDGAVIKSHAWVNSTIVGWNSRIGSWCRVTGVSVLGEDVQLSVCNTIRHTCLGLYRS